MMLINGMVGTIASSTCCFVYMCEFLPQKYHDHANTALWVLYVSVALVMTLYF
jgi:hypothetical protein